MENAFLSSLSLRRKVHGDDWVRIEGACWVHVFEIGATSVRFRVIAERTVNIARGELIPDLLAEVQRIAGGMTITRKVNELIRIDGPAWVQVIEIRGSRMKFRVLAPQTVTILRGELESVRDEAAQVLRRARGAA